MITFIAFKCRLLSDISRLEAKVERLEAQLTAKDRELATITRTVGLTSSILMGFFCGHSGMFCY